MVERQRHPRAANPVYVPDIRSRKQRQTDIAKGPTTQELRQSLIKDMEEIMPIFSAGLDRQRGLGRFKNKVVGGPNCAGCNRRDMD